MSRLSVEEQDRLQAVRVALEQHARERTADLARSHEALLAERDFTTWIVQGTPHVVCRISPDGKTLFLNPEGERVTGYRAEELLGRDWWEVFYPGEERRQVERLFQEMAGKDVRDHEMTLTRKDGGRRVVSWNSINRLDSRGQLVEVVGFGQDVTEHRRVVRALADSEVRFRTLFESAGDAIFLMTGDIFTECNRRTLEMFGCTREQIVGRRPQDFSPPVQPDGRASAAKARVRIAAALAGEIQRFDWVHCRLDRTPFDAEVSLSCVDVQGERLVQAVVRDVTDRNRAVAALRGSEARYRQLVEQLNEGLVVVDLEGRITFANPRMAALLGYGLEELLGMPFDELMLPGERHQLRERIERRQGGLVDRFERELRRKDGGRAVFLVSAAPMRDDAGAVTGSFAAFTDITERKEAERALHESEAALRRLGAAIAQSSDSIVVTDTSGRVLYANPATEALTGVRLEALVGRDLRTLGRSAQHDPDFYRQLWDGVLGGEVWRGHLHHQREDGSEYETDTTISPVRDEQGVVRYFVSSSRDVSRERELETQLRQAQRMEAIGVLAGGIAHDFNNILVPVMGYAELLREHVQEDATAASYVHEICSAGQRAADLVQQILTFSRQTEQVRKPVDVALLVRESLKLLRAAFPATIRVRREIDIGCGLILADPSQVHQVVMNLCTNAYHAMRAAGGTLTVSLDAVSLDEELVATPCRLAPGDYVRLRVADTGHGMDPETLRKVFLPFFTTKKVGEGTGLGLSIVHGIVTGSGGGVTVESVVGKGSVLSAYFPRYVGRAEERREESPALPVGHERILVVDDETSIGAMLREALTLLGYRPTVHTSSVRALEEFRRAPGDFDLVLTDLTMPEMTGLALARELHTLRPDLPVVLMTGSAGLQDRVPALSREFARALGKPMSPRAMAVALREVLDARPRA